MRAKRFLARFREWLALIRIARSAESRAHAKREAREIAAINRNAAALNAEMSDVLSLQAPCRDD